MPRIDERQLTAAQRQLRKWLFDVKPVDDDTLHRYIEIYYGYRIARHAVCEGHCSPFSMVADLFFGRYPDYDFLATGGRGGGKTMNLAIAEHIMMRFETETFANVGAVEAQAAKCYSYIQGFDGLDHFAPLLKSSIISRTKYRNGSEIEILPGTKNRVNSPHPRVAVFDEVDLMKWDVLQEGLSMPIRTGGRPPRTVFTSSLKKAYGPMIRLLEGSAEKALRTYTFCVFEIIKTCPPSRHQAGEGCFTCPLASECLDTVKHADGHVEYLPGPGKAARADGFMDIDDVIKKFRTMDEDTWRSQWRSERPSQQGLVYPTFDDKIHVIDYEYNPGLPVVVGVDFGYTNSSVALYAQVQLTGEIVIFAEDYKNLRTTTELGNSMKAAPWYENTQWRVGDPASADGRATLNEMGISIGAADNRKDLANDESGISKVRWALSPPGAPGPLLYFARSCVNTIKEIRSYHFVEQSEAVDKNASEQAAKIDDHAMDAMRYIVARLIRHKKPKGSDA